ncbi:MAG TPA: DUF1501 domain-containing protein [Chloroflexia bacterium]|nr:DUF1501 domain-containing protein [Chloroflexia bacterium]
MISRRNFCKTCGLMTMVGTMAPAFLAQTVTASSTNLAQGKRALVVVQMTGGNDGLNTVVPFADSAYYNVRPTLGLKDEAILKLNEAVALNSSLKDLKQLYDNGQMAVVQGVGYPNPNYSHFRSMEIWQSAQPDGPATGGWLGRLLEAEDKAGNKDALTKLGMTIGNTGQGGGAPLAFWTQKTVVLSYGGIAQFQFKGAANDRESQLAVARKIYGIAGQNDIADYINKTALDALNASDLLEKIASNYKPAVTYPKSPFADRLKNIAQLLNSDYGARIFYVSTDGSFDTHFNELTVHNRQLQTMSEALGAFYKDLEAHNLADSVLTMTFSEFGRRVAENGSHGTDHGSAAPMFILGGKNVLKPGLYGQQPSLTDLDNGNMKVNQDFRSVYGTVLKNWLGTDPQPVVGGDFPTLDFIK